MSRRAITAGREERIVYKNPLPGRFKNDFLSLFIRTHCKHRGLGLSGKSILVWFALGHLEAEPKLGSDLEASLLNPV
jgi:hypothetical protein